MVVVVGVVEIAYNGVVAMLTAIVLVFVVKGLVA